MPVSPYTGDERRVLNPHGRRHYRRKYSLSEVRVGLGVLIGLAGVAAWVAYMGAHPDPALFADPAGLLDPGTADVERGPLPGDLAAPGFGEGSLSRFDGDTLYKKINGRAPFFKSRGLVTMTFLSIGSEADPEVAVDVEFYDLGAPENALGAYTAEAGPGAESDTRGGGLSRVERNAMYVAVNQYYVRAIGTAESDDVVAQLAHLREALLGGLGGGEPELPWPHGVLSNALGVAPDRLAFHAENAFSFGFATDVYAGELDDQSEPFIVESAQPGALAAKFVEGFASYGEPAGELVKDRYLGSFSGAAAADGCVVGVRGAPDADRARALIAQLVEAVAGRRSAGNASKTAAGGLPARPEAVEPPPVEAYDE